MDPIVVTVGALASASATKIGPSQKLGGAYALTLSSTGNSGYSLNNIATSQSPGAAGNLTLNGTTVSSGVAYTPAGSSVTIASSGNDSAVHFTVYGQVYSPNNSLLYSSEVLLGANASTVATRTRFVTVSRVAIDAAAAGTVTVGTNGTFSLDKPRRVLLTFGGNDTGITVAVYGTDWNAELISETVTGVSGSTAYTVQDFATVTAVWPSGAVATTISVGTNGIASSRPIFLDRFGFAPTSLEVDVTGTVNYTVQQTLNTPNPIIVAPWIAPTGAGSGGYAAVNWVNHPDSNLVAATSTVQGNYAYIPYMTRITMNSGTGSITYTVLQAASSTGGAR